MTPCNTTSARPRPSALGLIFTILRPHWRRVGIGLFALLVSSGAWLALGQGVRVLIDHGFVSRNAPLLDHALLALLAIIVTLAGATFVRMYLLLWLGERLVADLRRMVFDRLIGLDVAFHDDARTGDVVSRLTADTATVQGAVGVSVSMALRNSVMLVGSVILLFATDGRLSAVALAVVLLVLIPLLLFGRLVRRLSRASQDSIADMGARAEETLSAIRTVHDYVQEDHERGVFDRTVERIVDIAKHRILARAALIAGVIFLVMAAIGVVLWMGGHDVITGRLSAGALSAFVFYAILAASSAGGLSEVVGELQRAAGALDQLIDLLERRPTITTPTRPVALPTPARGEVTFRHVTFSYPSVPEHPVLCDLDFTVSPGETVALIGPSGAGKSTVFHLLLRHYDPTTGHVMLDGVDLRHTDPQAVRRRLAVVAQDPVIFSANAWDNIRYGRPDASDEEVRAAADAAQALDFLKALPEGLNASLGNKGIRLSGGQRQRIAIARALLCDPSVLLLDEATSALDAENERLIRRALDHVMKGRTCLIIAHRLATVVNADRLMILDQGRCVATGTHQSLMAENSLYAHWARLQFAQTSPGEGFIQPDVSTPSHRRIVLPR